MYYKTCLRRIAYTANETITIPKFIFIGDCYLRERCGAAKSLPAWDNRNDLSIESKTHATCIHKNMLHINDRYEWISKKKNIKCASIRNSNACKNCQNFENFNAKYSTIRKKLHVKILKIVKISVPTMLLSDKKFPAKIVNCK